MARLVKFLEGPPHYLVLRTLNAVLFDGNLGTPTTGAVPVATSDGHKIVFKGDFTLSAGTVTGGTVTSFDVYFGSTKVLKARGYTVAIADALDAIDAATITGTETFNNLFFRNATVKGSNAGDYMFALEGGKALGRGGNDEVNAFGFGASALNGGDGDDILVGNGTSKLKGGEGDDIFHFFVPMGADKVKDFSVKDDLVSLDPSLFDSVPVGPLADIYFHVGKTAKTPDHHVIYNRKTGGLFVDDDGSGIQAQVQVAILPDHLKMKADNIFVADFF